MIKNRPVTFQLNRQYKMEDSVSSDWDQQLINSLINGQPARIEAIQGLLNQGADIHCQDDYALLLAASAGRKDILHLLLSHTLQPEISYFKSESMNEAFMLIPGDGSDSPHYLSSLDLLLSPANFGLDIPGADIHHENDFALLLAAQNGYTKMVQLLLFQGINIHAGDSMGPDAALRWAAHFGHTETVRLLIAPRVYGLDMPGIEIDSCNGYPLSWAVKNGHVATVNLLLNPQKYGLDLTGADPRMSQSGTLRRAARNGDDRMVHLLLLNGADIHCSNLYNCSDAPLQLAIKNKHWETVSLLLSWGADPQYLFQASDQKVDWVSILQAVLQNMKRYQKERVGLYVRIKALEERRSDSDIGALAQVLSLSLSLNQSL